MTQPTKLRNDLPLVTVGRLGLYANLDKDLSSLQSQFERQHYARLPGFLAPEVLSLIEPRISGADYFERVDKGAAATRELCMAINGGVSALLLLVNDEKLFEVIQDITSCPRIHSFGGRVYKFVAGAGHYHGWHNDLVENRFVAMSVNLGQEKYNGGVLQIRERSSKRIVSEVSNTGKGDAVIFRLSNQLEHRITGVTGSSAKVTFAGWFKGEGSLLPGLRHVDDLKNAAPNLVGTNTID